MTKHVQHQMAIEMKMQYLEIVSTNPKTVSAQCQHKVGAQAPRCPIHINTAEHRYRLQGLEHGVRAYLHDCSFPEGDGRKHQVRMQNLPQIQNPQVGILCSMFLVVA